jgi:lipoprotein NlpD
MSRVRVIGLVALVLIWIVVASALLAPTTPSAANTPTIHVIRSGDTLSEIAKQYGVTVLSIVRANGLRSESARLKVGTRLSIPAPGERLEAKNSRAPAATRRVPAVATSRRPGRMPDNLILAIPDFADPVPPFSWPVEGGVSSSFGRRRMGWHRGIDIVAAPGTPIVATAPGMVVASGVEGRYGRVVKLAHENGFVSVYAHNTENLVELGQWISAGQVIATVGRTGRATGEHLHFEIRREGLAYNPLYLLPLPPRMTQIEELDPDEEEEHD